MKSLSKILTVLSLSVVLAALSLQAQAQNEVDDYQEFFDDLRQNGDLADIANRCPPDHSLSPVTITNSRLTLGCVDAEGGFSQDYSWIILLRTGKNLLITSKEDGVTMYYAYDVKDRLVSIRIRIEDARWCDYLYDSTGQPVRARGLQYDEIGQVIGNTDDAFCERKRLEFRRRILQLRDKAGLRIEGLGVSANERFM